jgi:hypothetical protein
MSDRVRVQEKFTEEELQYLYSAPWEQAPSDHPHLENCPEPWTYWNIMIGLGKSFGPITSMADMSCGDARIARELGEFYGVEPVLGDYAPGYQYQGTLQETVPQLDVVDLFICTNTVEHLDDPDSDLKLVREHCTNLLVSTPVEEWEEPSTGHYWAWSRKGVEDMLNDAGFQVSAYVELDLTPWWNPHCKHGTWACR